MLHRQSICSKIVSSTLIILLLLITTPVCLSRWTENVYLRQCKMSAALTLQADNQSILFQCFLSSVRGDAWWNERDKLGCECRCQNSSKRVHFMTWGESQLAWHLYMYILPNSWEKLKWWLWEHLPEYKYVVLGVLKSFRISECCDIADPVQLVWHGQGWGLLLCVMRLRIRAHMSHLPPATKQKKRISN